MANGWTNTVPLGQAGTGAAFILPQNRAAQNFGSQLAYADRQRQLEEQRRMQQAQQLAQSYRDNMLTASSGRLWANQIGKLEQDHIRRGMEYRGKGIDIYNPNPNDANQMKSHDEYMLERARIEGLRNYRKGLETQYNDLQKTLQKANLGDYDPSDIQKLNDFVSGTSVVDLYNQNAQLPTINKRFNPSEFLPSKAAVEQSQSYRNEDGYDVRVDSTSIDEPRTQRSVLGSILNAPGGMEYVNRITGGIDPYSLINLPDNRDAIKDQVIKDYEGDPQLREALASAPEPVISGTRAFNEWVEEQANDLYGAKQRFQPQFDSWMSQVVGTTQTGEKETIDTSRARLGMQKESLNLRRAAANRAISEKLNANDSSGSGAYIGTEVIPVGGAEGNQNVTAENFIAFRNANAEITGGEAWDLDTMEKGRTDAVMTGAIAGLGEFPFDKKTGKLLPDGSTGDNVEYKKMALVKESGQYGSSVLIPASKVPKTLSKKHAQLYDEFMGKPVSKSKSSKPTAADLYEKYRPK